MLFSTHPSASCLCALDPPLTLHRNSSFQLSTQHSQHFLYSQCMYLLYTAQFTHIVYLSDQRTILILLPVSFLVYVRNEIEQISQNRLRHALVRCKRAFSRTAVETVIQKRIQVLY